MSLNEYLGVSSFELKKKGVYNGLNFPLDDRCFIDVFKAKGTIIPEFENSYTTFLEYFSEVSQLLKLSKSKNDLHWQYASRKLLFREKQGLCFGYSKTLGRGNGVGKTFATQMTNAAFDIVKNGIEHPEAFLFAPFLEDDIGFDRISDMVATVLIDDFLSYTERVTKEFGITKNLRRVKGKTGKSYLIPCYVNIEKRVKFPIIFCPESFVRAIPRGFDWQDPFEFYLDDGKYKDLVNNLICEQFRLPSVPKKEVKKTNLKDALFSNNTVFTGVVDTISTSDSVSVTLRSDATDHAILNPMGDNIKNGSIKDQVQFICDKFKFMIEDKGYWRSFYRDGYHLHEEHIQTYFYFLAQSYCERFGIDLFPEHHTGRGRVDFRVGITGVKPVLVEVKLSMHSRLFHGFEEQLPAYCKSEDAEHGIYLVVKMLDKRDFFLEKNQKKKREILSDEKKRIDRRIDKLSEKEYFGSIACEQVIVDAIPRESASVM